MKADCFTFIHNSGREVALYPGPMSVATGGYLAGPMHPNSQRKEITFKIESFN